LETQGQDVKGKKGKERMVILRILKAAPKPTVKVPLFLIPELTREREQAFKADLRRVAKSSRLGEAASQAAEAMETGRVTVKGCEVESEKSSVTKEDLLCSPEAGTKYDEPKKIQEAVDSYQDPCCAGLRNKGVLALQELLQRTSRLP